MLCVLVLPLPRSGSSMVAGILHHLGIDTGPSRPPDAANPAGYFEDERFRAIHQSWSRHHETDPARVRLRLPPWDPRPDSTDLARYDRLIRTCDDKPCWGVKDPELCYYARHFVAALRRPVRVIATSRDVGDVAASLRWVRRWFTPAECATIADDYARRQAATLEELAFGGVPPAMTVDYDEAIADPGFDGAEADRRLRRAGRDPGGRGVSSSRDSAATDGPRRRLPDNISIWISASGFASLWQRLHARGLYPDTRPSRAGQTVVAGGHAGGRIVCVTVVGGSRP